MPSSNFQIFSLRTNNIFENERYFRERTTFFMNNGVVHKKITNDGRTTWIVQRNEKTNEID